MEDVTAQEQQRDKVVLGDLPGQPPKAAALAAQATKKSRFAQQHQQQKKLAEKPAHSRLDDEEARCVSS